MRLIPALPFKPRPSPHLVGFLQDLLQEDKEVAWIPAHQLLQAPAVETQPSCKGWERPGVTCGLEGSGNSWGCTGAFPSEVRVSGNSGSTHSTLLCPIKIMISFFFLHRQEAQETQRGAGISLRSQGLATTLLPVPLESTSFPTSSEMQGRGAEAEIATPGHKAESATGMGRPGTAGQWSPGKGSTTHFYLESYEEHFVTL